MLLRWQLAQVREILQTLWRPGQEKLFICVQTLHSGGQRGFQRLSQEWLAPQFVCCLGQWGLHVWRLAEFSSIWFFGVWSIKLLVPSCGHSIHHSPSDETQRLLWVNYMWECGMAERQRYLTFVNYVQSGGEKTKKSRSRCQRMVLRLMSPGSVLYM